MIIVDYIANALFGIFIAIFILYIMIEVIENPYYYNHLNYKSNLTIILMIFQPWLFSQHIG